ncbi:MAG: hypothetical protein L6Q77_15040 [Bacteroidetes bacterium]|nr:hypothetical protein [Bacteroidota bacterium]
MILRFFPAALLLAVPVFSQPVVPAAPVPSQFSGLTIDMQWFLAYQNGRVSGAVKDEFLLKRGYVDIKKKINETFSGKITTDITVDREGDGMGDVEIRLKYLLLKMNLPDLGFLKKSYLEFGMIHLPWIDFEQAINDYRVQGTMFMERAGVMSSADFGVVYMTQFGESLDAEYQKTVSSSFPGQYGSMAVSLSNGGGYHALENNRNKSVQSRISIRPVHEFLPGFQVHHHASYGKGNSPEAPDWYYNAGVVSYEADGLVLTGTGFLGSGKYDGSAIQDTIGFQSVDMNGMSFFADVRVWDPGVNLFGRYDRITSQYHSGDKLAERWIAGLAFYITERSKLVFDFDFYNRNTAGKPNDKLFETVIELRL